MTKDEAIAQLRMIFNEETIQEMIEAFNEAA